MDIPLFSYRIEVRIFLSSIKVNGKLRAMVESWPMKGTKILYNIKIIFMLT